MDYPNDLKYTKSHEWVRLEGDVAVVGISDYAQDALGDVVFVELPEVGKAVAEGDTIAVVESVKTASDIYAPVAGEILEANQTLSIQPELLNSAPYGDGWMFKIKVANAADVAGLLSAADYKSFAEGQ